MNTVGIDLGGTNIAVGVVTEEGKILSQAQRRTLPDRPYQAVVRDMAEATLEAVAKAGQTPAEIGAIGVGVPGLFDNEKGHVIFCTNLSWHNVPLREEMRQYIDVPLYGDNDANVAGLAEALCGVSQGVLTSIFLTLGTGLGAGIIINGKIWSGAHRVAGELGHIMYRQDGIQCTCGAKGCLERYASGTALIRIGQEHAAKFPGSILNLTPPDRFTAKTVTDAVQRGDTAAKLAMDEYTTHLANGIITMISFLDPDLFVLGGGLSQAGDILLQPVREKVQAGKFFKTMPTGDIVVAKLGNDAGIIGAAMLHRA